MIRTVNCRKYKKELPGLEQPPYPGSKGQEIFETRYAYPGEKSWSERSKTVARIVASAEKDDEKEKVEKKFYRFTRVICL